MLLPGAVAELIRLIAEHPGFDAFALNVREFRQDPLGETDTPVAFTLPEDAVCTAGIRRSLS